MYQNQQRERRPGNFLGPGSKCCPFAELLLQTAAHGPPVVTRLPPAAEGDLHCVAKAPFNAIKKRPLTHTSQRASVKGKDLPMTRGKNKETADKTSISVKKRTHTLHSRKSRTRLLTFPRYPYPLQSRR